MAAGTFAIVSEREFGQVVLQANEANVDGGVDFKGSLPAGFGDCYLIRSLVECNDIATMMTNPQTFGPKWALLTAGGLAADPLAAVLWVRSFTLRLAAHFHPLIAPLWRDGEVLSVLADEVDTNAAPTVDLFYTVLVQRRRNMGLQGDSSEPPLRFTS